MWVTDLDKFQNNPSLRLTHRSIPHKSSIRIQYLWKSSSFSEMADSILERLNAKNVFDLRGVVAVVTGGSSVSGSRY